VAIIAMHTNLDCAPAARNMLLEPVGFEYTAPLHPHNGVSLGQLARPVADNDGITLGELAARYAASFGRVAKVWGSPSLSVNTLAACSGGAGEVVYDVIAAGADCFVVGELAYHEVLELVQAGVGVIELGHDVSELPYRGHLRTALIDAGFPANDIVTVEATASWWAPEQGEVGK
jgi:putative NIF3 family GTP cyclohydrolase 1 type 2